MQQGSSQKYDYRSAGYDGFMIRSIDNSVQEDLSSPNPQENNRQLAFDRSNISGALGDTFRVGNISLNGSDENIILSDGERNRLLLGKDNF